MTAFLEDFDSLLNSILMDYQNQFQGSDTSQGSLIFIKSACLASALWGLYKYQDYIANQIFPDTADSANLDHHGYIYGLPRKYAETDADYLTRLLNRIQQPPAGGNANDYVQWALAVTNVENAWCFPLAQGLGTVDVVIMADATTTGSEIPSSHQDSGTVTSLASGALVDANANFIGATPVAVGDVVTNEAAGTTATVTDVMTLTELQLSSDIFTAVGQAYSIASLCAQVLSAINAARPVGMDTSGIRVPAPTVRSQDVTISVTGAGANKANIIADITAYMQTLIPGQTLYLSQLIALALKDGADNATVTAPAADVVPTGYETIRPGTINVT